jgi:F0F1-type ATP synthase delta subunit
MSDTFSRRIIARTVSTKLFEGPAHRQHWVQVLAAYLVEHRHTAEVDLLVNDIAQALYDDRRYLTADLTTTWPLSADLQAAVERFLKAETGARDIELTRYVDSQLGGGFIAHTPDGQLDLTVKAQLKAVAAIK